YDREAAYLSIDRERSSRDPEVQRDTYGGAFTLAPGEPLRLHVFLDRSVVEVFANNRACVASRIYPSRPDSLGIGALALGGSARLTALDVWGVSESGPERT